MIVTNDWELAEQCDSLLWMGRKKGRPWYEHHQLGWNYRITEFQAALLLVQLSRLDAQNARRMENARYLAEALSEIEGLTPLKWDPRTTKHSFHIFILRYNPNAFQGVPRERFAAALEAEGIPAFHGYMHPVYANPMFINQNFYTQGCPVNCHLRDFVPVDYAAFADLCPVSERASREEAVWLEHRLLLGDKKDMDDIVGAIQKVVKNINELT
jgi:dTDP-4-amino-4,6-dideoxygalactose transaminase